MHCEIFQRCELLNKTIARCTSSWQQNVIKYMHNFLGISLSNFNQKIICYFCYIKNVWSGFFDHNKSKMQLINCAIVEIVEFIVSQTFKKNVQKFLGQIQNNEIFETFNRKIQNQIWNKLIFTKYFILFFCNFFRNMNYLNALIDNIKLLIDLALNNIIFAAFSKTLNQKSYDVAI